MLTNGMNDGKNVDELRNIAKFVCDKGAKAIHDDEYNGICSPFGESLVAQSDAFLAGLDGVLP